MIWRIRFYFNWLYWAIRFREIPPRGVGYVCRPSKLSAAEIARARELAKRLPPAPPTEAK